MNTTRLQQARRLFFHDMVDPHTARRNACKWAKAIRQLEGRWLLSKPVEKHHA